MLLHEIAHVQIKHTDPCHFLNLWNFVQHSNVCDVIDQGSKD